MMYFTKPAIDVPQQLELLKPRVLQINDEERVAELLEVIGFFRVTSTFHRRGELSKKRLRLLARIPVST